MAAEPINNLDPARSEQLSQCIQQLLSRYPAYTQVNREELKNDAISRLIADYLFAGSRNHFEAGLHGMLTDEERQRLSIDPTFTQAWQIFVEVCWIKRLLSRWAVLLGIIVLLVGVCGFLVWAAPYLIGPKHR